MNSLERDVLTYLQAAEIVLRDSEHPLGAREIVREIQQRHLAQIRGETPWNTINARISEDIVQRGSDSPFVRIDPGLYTLRSRHEGREYIVPPRPAFSPTSEVLVFPSEILTQIGHFHGIRQDYEPYVSYLLNTANSLYIPREEAEETEQYKQIVSYILIKHRNQLLRFVRGKITSVYKYLYGEYSIGFGGHVEKRDWNLFSVGDGGYGDSIRRELMEELGIDLDMLGENTYELRMIGVLNDDSSALGRRHFAFVHLLEIKTDEFRKGIDYDKGEKSVNDLRMVSISSFSNEFAGYEYWSKLVMQTFFSAQLATACHIESRSDFVLAQQKKVILVVGYIGSGKTEACYLLASEFGYTLVPCSSVMQKLIGCDPIEVIGRKQLQDKGLALVRQPDGHLRLAEALVDYMRESGGSKFVLDGLRYRETLEALRQLLDWPITTIYIETTVDRLLQYYQSREGVTCNMREYIDIISHPVERAIERFVHLADITIYNHGSRESYTDVLREFFKDELGES